MNAASPAPAVLETHVSYVFLVGDRAAKLKKPVRFPFLDLSTRERREVACHREVELNRRLAPDVYLGVVDLVGPDGRPFDHLVAMRRLPDDRRLATLVAERRVEPAELDALGRQLAVFHAAAARGPAVEAEARPEAVRARWEAGFREVARFVGPVLDAAAEDEIERLAARYLDGRAELFEARIRRGCVVDGHGDLLADDVFVLPDGPRILDCLEFDDRLRYGDVVADVAFLAMDLERLGAGDLARVFLDAYREYTAETHPASLEHHYVAYRAHVRAKVACLRGTSASEDEARRLLEIARTHLRRARVTLVLVGGGPATGKSTLAAGIGDRLTWSVIRSDEVRKDVVGLGHRTAAPAAVDEGVYAPATTDATYVEMLARARRLLEHGESVVLDATWSDPRQRARAHELAAATATDVIELRCDVSPDEAAARARARVLVGGDPSDAGPEIARAVAARADPWPAAAPIDTAQDPGAALADALAVIGDRGETRR